MHTLSTAQEYLEAGCFEECAVVCCALIADDSNNARAHVLLGRALAAKTTLRDRWRQVLEEADKVTPIKHLLTLQEGVSDSQFAQIQEAGVQLVVPQPLHDRYNSSIRPNLMTFEQFITEVRLLQQI